MMAKKRRLKPARRERRLPAYWLHAVLVLILGVECALAVASHRSRSELERDLQTAAPAQRVYALYVLTNRDTPQRVNPQLLLDSDEPLLREWTLTTNFTRLARPTPQLKHLDSLGGSPEAIRSRFLFSHGIGKQPWITLPELRAFLDALDK
jgi:hypothetical protein